MSVNSERFYNWLPYLLFLGIGLVVFPSSGEDDAYITYWAARTLADFGRIMNHSGAAVEQSSSLLHTLLLALLSKLTRFQVAMIGPAFTIACGALTIWLLGELAVLTRVPKLPAQLLLATATPFVYWSFGGLETTLIAAIVTALLIAYVRCHRG